MRKLLTFLFLSIGYFAMGQQTKKVFFIGNSYISTGNIPGLVQQIAADSGDELIYTAHTPGGATFQQHASNPFVISTIQQADWDFVVLQEQSQLPSFPDNQVEQMVLPYAHQLSEMVKEYNHCAQVNFYMTWGRKEGDAQNCPSWPPVCTYQGMDDLISQRYMLMAELNQATVSPVGKVWRYIRENYPAVELYLEDNSHPSAVGSMAAAYTFYTVFFKKSPFDSEYSGSISSENMNIIKEAVQQIVFNNMDQWHLWDFQPNSDFEYSINGTQVSFSNLSANADFYLWNFGDGTTSEEENPVHIFEQQGSYTVSLTVEKCGEEDTSEHLVELPLMSIDDLNNTTLIIYPNPVTEVLSLISQEKILQIEILDLCGKKLLQLKSLNKNKLSVDVRFLKAGVFVVLVRTNGGIKKIKLLKK